MKRKFLTKRGKPYPFGATVKEDGVNFALFSHNATGVELLLFDSPEDKVPSHKFLLNPEENKTGAVWHIFISGLTHGQLYGYRVDGLYDPRRGHIFNKYKMLSDPYTKAVAGKYNWDNEAALAYEKDSPQKNLSFNKKDNIPFTVKSVVIDDNLFDWTGDRTLKYDLEDSIIYEMHVRGFTFHPSSGTENPGTFKGIIEKIPYLKELGITAIELMPIHDFNPDENIKHNPVTGERLKNYWGYSPLSFFAPANWYSCNCRQGEQVEDFKEMVKACHRAGIEVILDVVYNHTGEGSMDGPICNFRGLDNSIYYMFDHNYNYKNYSGCGNTFNCNHPAVKQLLLESLRYWVAEMHVDGFRFDLATILGRDRGGKWIGPYSILTDIREDPLLSEIKLIAEGWDAGGLYMVGQFPPGWAEWNGKYRDDVRRFMKGDPDLTGILATRIAGSSDLYGRGRNPFHSINFITCHDGFTLRDLVSYNYKHNYENGEDNYDGANDNFSWNCGTEGETKEAEILEMRIRQIKNYITILMLSQGTPMIFSGDEMFKTHMGNNNAYCQDTPLNWLDWKYLKENREIFRYFKEIIAFRKAHPALRRKEFFTGLDHDRDGIGDITWHGIKPYEPDWSFHSHSLAFMIDGCKEESGQEEDDNNIYMAINSYWKELKFELPDAGKGKSWYRVVDTHLKPPRDIVHPGKELRMNKKLYTLKGRSVAVFISM